jgi:hypothetical protein
MNRCDECVQVYPLLWSWLLCAPLCYFQPESAGRGHSVQRTCRAQQLLRSILLLSARARLYNYVLVLLPRCAVEGATLQEPRQAQLPSAAKHLADIKVGQPGCASASAFSFPWKGVLEVGLEEGEAGETVEVVEGNGTVALATRRGFGT